MTAPADTVHEGPPLGGAIDVHAHFLTARLCAAMEEAGPRAAGWHARGARLEPEAALAVMDRKGIAAALLSVSSPGVHYGDDRAARELARAVNDEGAALV
ncbi:hypothetical protein ACPC3D_33160 [Streptomyces cellulosae]|nr:hypothetical protein GCM10018771_65910 [Streptomyces cellulosae]